MSDSPEPDNGSAENKNHSVSGYGTPFHGGPAPMSHWNWEITKEREWHRPCAVLAAHGVGINKIAETLGKARQTISNVFRQQWFSVMVQEEMREARQDFGQLFRNEVVSNLAVLASIRDDENAPTNARVLSAKELNDRALGRPIQPIAATQFVEPDVTSDNVNETVARLEAEIDRMYAQRHGITPRLPSSEESHADDK
jgi:hypothetical protein